MKLLNPTIDLVFKLLLTRNQQLLRSMLEAILDESITEFTILDPNIPGELAADKAIVIDVRVVLGDGRRIIVEMQVRATSDLQSRLVFYTARDYANQAKRGQSYESLTATVTIVWLVQPLFPKLHQLHSVFELRERNTHQPFSQDLALHLLQLSEIPEQPSQALTSAERRVQLWARFLAARTPEARAELAQEDPTMANAIESLEELSADPELARQAEARELSRFFYELGLANAKKEGRLEGLLEGKQAGLLEGKQVGLFDGKQVGLLEGKQVGLLEGKQVGLLEGEKKGLLETLLFLLRSKFGEIPESVQARLHQGTPAELKRWVERLLSASALADVFCD